MKTIQPQSNDQLGHSPQRPGQGGGSLYHIYWLCPIAQAIWTAVRSWWQAQGLWTASDAATGDSFLHAIFSLQLPHAPPKAWDLTTLHRLPSASTEDAADPFPVFQAVWQQIALESLVFLLSWRRKEPQPLSRRPDAHALTLHDANCQRVLRTLAVRLDTDPQAPPYASQLVWELRSVFQRDTVPPPASTVHDGHEHILFFDGGSRGNPGPGGAGSVLVAVDRLSGATSLRWSAATSFASSTTTNNQAEYLGLIRGLQAATDLAISSLTVIGDSALIIRQMLQNRPPRNATLLRLYRRARRLADRLPVRTWTHHYRANNKMADHLANLAMDTAHITYVHHPTTRAGHDGLSQLLATDLSPWLAALH